MQDENERLPERAEDWEDHRLLTDADGTRHALSASRVVTILPDGVSEVRLTDRHPWLLRRLRTLFGRKAQPAARQFHRNGIQKNLRTGKTVHKRVLVCELDGVRVYFRGKHVIITRQDIYL